MGLKDTKIFIPDIPKEWKDRVRSGHTNIWNKGKENEIKLNPPIEGLYAERFNDGWYWVCGCHKCLGNNKPYSYIVCEEHDRCITCGTHRKDLTEIPWGHPDGFQCKACAKKEHEQRKKEALKEAKRIHHSEDDCWGTSEIICPKCATVCLKDDIYGEGEHEITCHVCDTIFNVELEYEVKYTSKFKKERMHG